MSSALDRFEALARRAKLLTSQAYDPVEGKVHPFDERNIHPDIAGVARQLFDDGYYAQATFEAFKFIDNEVSRVAKHKETGYKLMMTVFNENNPKIKLTALSSISEIDEQRGFSFLFAGSATAIRNPRGHVVGNHDTVDLCLDHLGLASLLLRRLIGRLAP